jgi:hypothetical protein
MKLEVIQPSEIGSSPSKSKTGRWHGLTSTLSTILKNKDRIQSSVLCDGRLMRQKLCTTYEKENFEFTLLKWFCHETSAALLVHGSTTMAKATHLTAHF